MPLTQPRRGGGGGPLGDPVRVRGHLRVLSDVLRTQQRRWHPARFVLIDEEAITGFIKTEFEAGAGANIVI